MGRIYQDHFCILVFGQGLWKDSFTKKISKETKVSFFHLSGYSKDSLFCTCPICNALIKLFDPEDPGEYVDFCDLCKALHEIFKDIKGQNDGVIFFSHNLMDIEALQNLVQNLLSDKQIKKIYILEIEFNKLYKYVPVIMEMISQDRLKKSDFIELLKDNKFEYCTIYEIFKDKYY